MVGAAIAAGAWAGSDTPRPVPLTQGFMTFLPPHVLLVVGTLLMFSAFFSACETAFFAIPKQRLRALCEENHATGRLIARMMENPGHLLTSILVGNMLVNTITGVVLGTRVKDFFEQAAGLSAVASYILAIVAGTGILLFFGEITPKVFAIRAQETYARVAVVPMFTIVKLLTPLCNGLLSFTDMLFRVTRLREIRAMPYITDDELKSFLAAGADQGGAEEEGRQMIRRILEFNDVTVKEILTPRPDIVALHESATVAEALVVYRDHGYSRIPLYAESLDHITGVLYAKELLPSLSKGNLIRPVKDLARAPHFVPETMKVQAFVRHVQRHHAHLGIVVDEYGGTEGLVSLQDAIEQVVGDIGEEGEEDSLGYERLGPTEFRVDGNLDLDELSELIEISLDDEEHQTVAGFVMNKAGKVPEEGDRIEFSGVTFTVERVSGKRVESVRIEAPHTAEEPGA